ncbi:zinc finger protein 845-like [Acanthaster planci]|uniref:Zinc finger protein 845-like n=1 Tax=Acanthaster planci TaxID=133434 RepID=A0A8B7YMA8_ACAPL|nr:zinc finger protein 845-like [Acanthaster planci]
MAGHTALTRTDADTCKSPINYSMSSFPALDVITPPPVEDTKPGWPEFAQDLRVDRVRRRARAGKTSVEAVLHRCGECSYVTKRRTNLERHRQAMHSRDKQLECCGSLFNSKSELRRHVRHQHDTGYGCPHCGRVFCRKALLKRHMSVHNGVKEFACRICSYASSHKSNLERHQRIHGKHNPDCKTKSNDSAVLKTRQAVRSYVRDQKVDEFMAHLNTLYHKITWGATTEDKQEGASSAISVSNLSPKRMFANPYKCLLCKERWQSQEALKKHERACHPDLEVRALLSLPMEHVLHLISLAGVRISLASYALQ